MKYVDGASSSVVENFWSTGPTAPNVITYQRGHGWSFRLRPTGRTEFVLLGGGIYADEQRALQIACLVLDHVDPRSCRVPTPIPFRRNQDGTFSRAE